MTSYGVQSSCMGSTSKQRGNKWAGQVPRESASLSSTSMPGIPKEALEGLGDCSLLHISREWFTDAECSSAALPSKAPAVF